MADRNTGPTADGRNPDGTFTKGNPGRPRGTRFKITRAVQDLLDGEADKITRKRAELALDGDTKAMRLYLERIAPPRKDAPVRFDLPPIKSSQDAFAAAEAALREVSIVEITPLDGASVMWLVENLRRVLETTEVMARLEAIEERARR